MTVLRNGFDRKSKFHYNVLTYIETDTDLSQYAIPYDSHNPSFMESWVRCMIDGKYGFAYAKAPEEMLYVTLKKPGQDQQQTYLFAKQSPFCLESECSTG